MRAVIPGSLGEREARISGVSESPEHPLRVYGLQRTDGVPALVSELVSGHTLSDVSTGDASSLQNTGPKRHSRSPGALDAAHERSVNVPKDLKPQKHQGRPDGTVKIPDFRTRQDHRPTGTLKHDCPAADELLACAQAPSWNGCLHVAPGQRFAADRRSDLWAARRRPVTTSRWTCALSTRHHGRHARRCAHS